ncbi:MAG: hypothetical protein KDB27_27445 [Planctomycetales bacterium]|nr:hypothetical protein [Planctomycetales bacterium]
MTLKHLAAFLMLLCALGCQPSDSGDSGASDSDGGAASSTDTGGEEEAAADDSTAQVADPAEEELQQVAFKVDGMR